jgi:hypothetical protein
LQRTYSEISNFSIALFKFLMPTRLFSASIFSRVSFFSATGLSASSNGGPTGRGSLARPSCRRRLKKNIFNDRTFGKVINFLFLYLWITASLSCNADLSSREGAISDLDETVDLDDESLPILDLRRLLAVELKETSMLAI